MEFYLKMIVTEAVLGIICAQFGRVAKKDYAEGETNPWLLVAGFLYLSVPLTFLVMLWRVL